MASNPEIKDAVTRIQTALSQLGFRITDPAGVYGGSTEAAVLKFKGPPRNILGPGQTKPDAIVGIQTIQRLDEAISPRPSAPPLEFGSTNWRFTFFGNKGITGTGIYDLFIASTELSDSSTFSMKEFSDDGDLIGGFRGETLGQFKTPRKVLAADFSGAISSLSIQKRAKLLNGFLQLNVSSKQFIVNLFFTPFQEERVLGGALTSGTLLVRGQIATRRVGQ
ncbi:MAG: peptidoglycan-binding domain-containing protein [Bryobacteraceae bacterium]